MKMLASRNHPTTVEEPASQPDPKRKEEEEEGRLLTSYFLCFLLQPLCGRPVAAAAAAPPSGPVSIVSRCPFLVLVVECVLKRLDWGPRHQLFAAAPNPIRLCGVFSPSRRRRRTFSYSDMGSQENCPSVRFSILFCPAAAAAAEPYLANSWPSLSLGYLSLCVDDLSMFSITYVSKEKEKRN